MERGKRRPPARAFYDGQGRMDARQRGRFMMGKGEWTATDELPHQTQGIDFIIFFTLPKNLRSLKKISKKNRHIFYFSP